MGRSPILQPPRSGMKASPIAWIRGPHSRMGIRESPAWASIAVLGRGLGRLRVQGQVAADGILDHRHSVQLQQGRDNLDVLDLRNVPQHRRFVAQQGCHHRFGNKVLGPTDADAACKRDSAADCQNTTHIPVSLRLLAPKHLQRLQLSIGGRVTEPKYGGAKAAARRAFRAPVPPKQRGATAGPIIRLSGR